MLRRATNGYLTTFHFLELRVQWTNTHTTEWDVVENDPVYSHSVVAKREELSRKIPRIDVPYRAASMWDRTGFDWCQERWLWLFRTSRRASRLETFHRVQLACQSWNLSWQMFAKPRNAENCWRLSAGVWAERCARSSYYWFLRDDSSRSAGRIEWERARRAFDWWRCKPDASSSLAWHGNRMLGLCRRYLAWATCGSLAWSPHPESSCPTTQRDSEFRWRWAAETRTRT